MNFCTRCASYYTQPGTCNCFAGARQDAAPWRYPYNPSPPISVPYVAPVEEGAPTAAKITITTTGDPGNPADWRWVPAIVGAAKRAGPNAGSRA